MTITSPHNPRLKELRRLARARERARSGLFLAEGEDLVLAAQAAGRRAVEGFRAPGALAGDERFLKTSPQALAAVSMLGSGTRAIGVYEQRWSEPIGPLCVYLHGVRDPGNVGAVLRGALAFGASCVALGPGCADPHSPKAVRASMGAIFAMRIARAERAEQLPGERIALVAHAGEPLWRLAHGAASPARLTAAPSPAAAQAGAGPQTDRPDDGRGRLGGEARPVTLLVGSERDGLPAKTLRACEHVAHIPIACDSLNAAMAATVALYEIARPSTRVPE